MTIVVEKDLLIEVLAAFENGEELHADNPFDVEIVHQPDVLATLTAFAAAAARDAPEVGDVMPDAPASTPEEDRQSVALAGLLQGLAIGFEYGKRQLG